MEYIYKNYKIKWESLHGKILTELINQLNAKEIKFFILRNFEGLPKINTSKDVDIIIEPNSYKRALTIFLRILKDNEISNYKIVKYERVHCCFGIDSSKHFSIHIDLIEGYLSKGFEIFSFNTLYKNTKQYKNFRVLNEEYDAIMLLYYKVIGTKELKLKYQDKIIEIYSKQAKNIDNILLETLGNKNSNKLF